MRRAKWVTNLCRAIAYASMLATGRETRELLRYWGEDGIIVRELQP